MHPSKSKNNREIIGGNIRKFRREQKLTQKELAKRIGINNSSYISRVEKGKQNVNMNTLEKISKALSIELRDLFPSQKSTLHTKMDEDRKRSIIRQFNELLSNNREKAGEVVKYILSIMI